MTIEFLANVIQWAGAGALAMFVLCRLWPSYRVDSFRHSMFAIRDELFSYAASGKIEFSHPAYRLLRQLMNSYLRYGHQLTMFQVLMKSMSWRIHGAEPKFEWMSMWEEALGSISDKQVRRDLVALQARAVRLVFETLIKGSPVFLLVVAIGVLYEKIGRAHV